MSLPGLNADRSSGPQAGKHRVRQQTRETRGWGKTPPPNPTFVFAAHSVALNPCTLPELLPEADRLRFRPPPEPGLRPRPGDGGHARVRLPGGGEVRPGHPEHGHVVRGRRRLRAPVRAVALPRGVQRRASIRMVFCCSCSCSWFSWLCLGCCLWFFAFVVFVLRCSYLCCCRLLLLLLLLLLTLCCCHCCFCCYIRKSLSLLDIVVVFVGHFVLLEPVPPHEVYIFVLLHLF